MLVTHWLFNFLIFLLILANTFTLAMYSYNMPEKRERVLMRLNVFFTWAFATEMFLKLIGLGPINYCRDRFNIFDAVIAIVSLVDWAVTFFSSKTPQISSQSSVLKVFRALRLLRVMKLARGWKELQNLLKKIKSALIDILSFTILLILFIFIFALLGMQFFA